MCVCAFGCIGKTESHSTNSATRKRNCLSNWHFTSGDACIDVVAVVAAVVGIVVGIYLSIFDFIHDET